MLKVEDIKIKSFKIERTMHFQHANLILDKHSGLLDYISLGTYCLYKSLINSPKNIIYVAKRDFSKHPNSTNVFLGDRCLALPANSFVDVSCKYVEHIANYISGRKYYGNITLGAELSMFLSLHLLGENVLIRINEDKTLSLSDILPSSWNMKDTVEAQKLAFNLIKMAFEVCVEPMDF